MVKAFCIYTLRLSEGGYPFLSTGDLVVIAGFVIYGLLCLVVRKELEFWYVLLMKPKLPRTLDATLILPTIILTWTRDQGRIV